MAEYKPKYDSIDWEKCKEEDYRFVELEKILNKPFAIERKQISSKSALCIIQDYEANKFYCILPYFTKGKYPDKKMVYNENELDISKMVFDKFIYADLLQYYDLKNAKFNFIANATGFLGDADFREISFNGDANFGGAFFYGDVYFTWASFSGEADFYGASFCRKADFGEVSFMRHVNFRIALFRGDANFGGVTFRANADFMKAIFSGIADFDEASFNRDTDFRRSKFKGLANFREASFSGWANFQDASFSGDAKFSRASFSGKADFILASFSEDAIFSRVSFNEEAYFEKAVFSAVANFNKAKIKKLVLDDCEIREIFYLDYLISLDELSISDIENYGPFRIRWDQDNSEGEKKDLEECIYKLCINNQDENLSESDYNQIKEQLRFLKENFGKNGIYEDEDKAHFAFKKAERMEKLFEDNEKIRWDEKRNIFFKFSNLYMVKYPFTHVGNWLMEKVGGYGTRPKWVLRYMWKTVLVFAIIFFLISFIPVKIVNEPEYNLQSSKIELSGEIIPYEKSDNVIKVQRETAQDELRNLLNAQSDSVEIVPVPMTLLEQALNVDTININYPVQQITLQGKLDNTVNIFANNKKIPSILQKLWNSVYLSGITFVTVGFGDIRPEHWTAQILAVAEGFLGLFLMSYLTIAFSRKVLR